MSDSDKPSMQWGPQRGTPNTSTATRGWRRFWNLAWLRVLWTRRNRAQGAAFRASWLGRLPLPRRAGTWMVIVWVFLLCLPIAGIVLGYVRRPAAGTSGISTGTSPFDGGSDAGKIPKPSAGKPMLPVSQAPPPTVTHSTAAPIEPEAPSPIATPSRPASPTGAPAPAPSAPLPPPVPPGAKPVFAAVTYPARHEKHFGDQCSGQLTLNSSGLSFACPGGSDGVDVAINQIDAVDDNGVRLFSGKKYHFTISGMSKMAERQLFADWLSRVR